MERVCNELLQLVEGLGANPVALGRVRVATDPMEKASSNENVRVRVRGLLFEFKEWFHNERWRQYAAGGGRPRTQLHTEIATVRRDLVDPPARSFCFRSVLQKSARLAWGERVMTARPSRSVARMAAFAIALSGLWNVGLAQEVDWVQQFGTEGFDDGTAIAADATGVYVAGRVEGALPGQVQGGRIDGFVRKYDFFGVEIWTRQFSFNENNTEPFAIAVDDTGVYVAGRSLCSTYSDRCGGFALKMDHDGQSIWTHFWGTAPSGNLTTLVEAWGIAVDGSRIYVTGDGTDGSHSTAVVSRLDQMGNEIWARTAGITPGAQAHASGIAVNATGIYVAGTLGTADVRRFDVDGNVTAEYGLGTIHGEIFESLVIDDSGIYVSGVPCPPQCQFAATVRKYAYDGTILWTSEVTPTAGVGVVSGDMAIDEQGIYLTGVSDLTASTKAFVRRYDKDDGEVGWTLDLSPPGGHASGDGLATHAGKVYVTGFAVGAFPGQTATPNQDVFVAQLNESMLPLVLSEIRPKAINPRSKGVISLVIFSTPDFDATFVDPLSIRFGPAGATEVHQRGHLSDVDGDGDTDLVLHFATQATGIACGDTEASFTGETFAGVAIRGSDSFVTVGCPVERDNNGIKRSEHATDEFKKSHPCPSTNKSSGFCPGYVIDHVKPLKRGGADDPSNMQWQTTADAKAKDKAKDKVE